MGISSLREENSLWQGMDHQKNWLIFAVGGNKKQNKPPSVYELIFVNYFRELVCELSVNEIIE